MAFLYGSDPYDEQRSLLEPGQQPGKNQLFNAAQGQRGAGGAYGAAADYYYNNLSDNPADFEAFAKPEMRRYNEQIIPDLAEQFAGMGAGNLSSSGFRNAAVSAGTDLSERLGQIRANLRQNAAQGLQNIGQQSLQPYVENVTNVAQPGLLEQALPAVISGAATAFGGPVLGAAAGGLSNWISSKGQSSPYGGNSKMPGGNTSGKYNLPTFMGR